MQGAHIGSDSSCKKLSGSENVNLVRIATPVRTLPRTAMIEVPITAFAACGANAASTSDLMLSWPCS